MSEHLINETNEKGARAEASVQLTGKRVRFSASRMDSEVLDEKSPLLSVQELPKDKERDESEKIDEWSLKKTKTSPRQSGGPARQPFTHNSMTNLYGNPEDIHKSATYHRYKYISKLSGHSTDMIIPDHMLPVELFLVIPGKPEAKQSSLVTIFAIWNTMMGTSLLSMPWALSQAGFGCGIGLMVGIAGLCLYTCYLVLKSSYPFAKKGESVEFADICRKYFGRTGELVATIFSIAAIAGAAVVFWVLMSNFLFNSGKFIHESIYDAFPKNMSKLEVICPVPSANNTSPNTMPNSDTTGFYRYWQGQKTIPFFLIALMFPLCSVKSPTFFTKFNSLGTLAVIYIIIFVSIKASIWGINMDFAKIPEFQLTFPALTGTLTLAFFIHNCILSILSHQKTPEYNVSNSNFKPSEETKT